MVRSVFVYLITSPWNRVVSSISLSPSRESCFSSSYSLIFRKWRSMYSSLDHRVRLCMIGFKSVRLRSTAAFLRVFADLMVSWTDDIVFPRSWFLSHIWLTSRFSLCELQPTIGLPVSFDILWFMLVLSAIKHSVQVSKSKPYKWRTSLKKWMCVSELRCLLLLHSFGSYWLWPLPWEREREAPFEARNVN